MAGKRSRRSSRGRGKVLREEGYQLVAEVVERRDPALLMEMAAEAVEVLENPETSDDIKAFMLGRLCMAGAFVKFWRFYWPPKVELEWVFDDPRKAKMLADVIGRFENVIMSTRSIDGKEYASVRLNWQFWRAMGDVFDAPVAPPDIIAENYLRQKSPRKALKRLMQDLALFSTATGTEPKLVNPSEEAEER